MKSAMRILLFAACVMAVAFAACPNGCSGHGDCNGFDQCDCYKEGKALYLGAALDPTTGQDPRALHTTTGAFRSAKIVVECAGTPQVDSSWSIPNGGTKAAICTSNLGAGSALAAGAGLAPDCSAGNTATCYLVIKDPGNYATGSAVPSCTIGAAVTVADQYEAGCPSVNIKAYTNGIYGATADDNDGGCIVTISSTGELTEVACIGSTNLASIGTLALDSVSVTVSMPSFSYYSGGSVPEVTPLAQWTGADCSLMTCPRGMSFIQVSTATVSSGADLRYTHVDDVECSDKGVCDRSSGVCQCEPGWEGKACERAACPDGCSGHGICQSNVKFAQQNSARYLHAWDSGKEFGCKCDSGWRGVNCALKECPSSADPLGFHGNEEGRDCSGRGLCDFASGLCQCFSGFTGTDCGSILALI